VNFNVAVATLILQQFGHGLSFPVIISIRNHLSADKREMFLLNVGYIPAIRAAIKSHLGFMVRHFWLWLRHRVLGI